MIIYLSCEFVQNRRGKTNSKKANTADTESEPPMASPIGYEPCEKCGFFSLLVCLCICLYLNLCFLLNLCFFQSA